jgi:osmotically inducible protein OsmC
MAVRTAEAEWKGNLSRGSGQMKLGSGVFEGSFSFPSRFEDGPGTNPEELIGAAHAGCFSMALSHMLSEAGHIPDVVHTKAKVHIDKVDEGFKITTIELQTEAKVPGINEETFQKKAEAAKEGCPVSQALAGTDIKLEAKLLS